jgi:hypothetical protein
VYGQNGLSESFANRNRGGFLQQNRFYTRIAQSQRPVGHQQTFLPI